ncbi:MAG TPA: ABC transporter permease [Calditrichaeota bacterium]|nr:ABC transporter permease [Calditrichota bacterium]
MSSLWFTFKEGLKGFKRARLATTITISSLAIALFLIGIFLVLSLNVNRWIGDFREKIELEVFFESDLTESEGRQITEKIQSIEGIKEVKYISKEEAARRFKKEFGRDIYEVLDYNPLPSSCTVAVKKGYQNSLSVRKIAMKIETIDGVNEVLYQKELMALIDRYINLLYIIATIIGLVLITISIILLYNTIRLTIFARRNIIEIMQLVGATSAFIRRPFIVEGLIQGLIGGLLAGGLLYGTVKLARRIFFPHLIHSVELYASLIIAGILIGVLSSRLSVSRYLQKI